MREPFNFFMFKWILRIVAVAAIIILAMVVIQFVMNISNAYDDVDGAYDGSNKSVQRFDGFFEKVGSFFGGRISDALDDSEGSAGVMAMFETDDFEYDYDYAVNGAAAADPSVSPSSAYEDEADGDTVTEIGSDRVMLDEAYLTVEFIDVGQADCILIYTEDDHAMMIDAGNNSDGELVVGYVESLGIDHLDYVVGTHAHEDHIGGLDDVIASFDIDYIMLPLVDSDAATYQSVLSAADNNSYATRVTPAVGDEYSLGDAVFTVYSCDDDPDDDLNCSSIVIRLDYGDASFLFMGDALMENENEMMDAGLDLDVDVLKVGHHGSYTSSGYDFLCAVSPLYAVIMCGADNEYGHPHDVTIDDLEATGSEILRTDLDGSIRVMTDGEGYSIHCFQTDTDGS